MKKVKASGNQMALQQFAHKHDSFSDNYIPMCILIVDLVKLFVVHVIPWKNGKPIVWDATCPDTLALSYHHQATIRAGAVADLVGERKTDKYSSLGAGYSFTPVAIETLGAMGKRSLAFVRELGHRVMQCTGEVKARTYLLQHLSIALQRGNAVSVMGSVGGWSELDLFCV